MALSYARPDPSSPAAVASAAFGTSRRGYDSTQVREFLRQVAAELSRLQERERELERELAAIRRAPAPAVEDLDEATITHLLGEETARVLSTAREAAAQIRARAEDGSARLFREAQDDATRLREQAEMETARKRQETARAVEAELEAARHQGRDMVAEAREYRERVLADLAKRRELARQQLAQLQGGRERLLQAFERARLVAIDVQGELEQLGDEPDELVNLAPTTGPVPIVVPRSQVPLPAAGRAARPTADPEPDGSTEPIVDAEPSADATTSAVPVVEESDPRDHDTDAHQPEVTEPDAHERDEGAALAPVVALFAGELTEPPGSTGEHDEERRDTSTVDDLFARLRAAKIDEIARHAAPATSEPVSVATAAASVTDVKSEPEVEPIDSELSGEAESPFVARDEALAPIELNLARKFKRALADEQNDLLDVLRRREPVRSIDDVLPAAADHLSPYVEAANEELPAAARAGARSTSSDDPARLDRRVADAAVVARAVESVGPEIVDPLRDRLVQAIAAADGDNGVIAAAVRSMYREWKTQRLDELAAELARAAYARGGYAAIVPGTAVRWVSEPGFAGCRDTAANEQAGSIRAGDVFPSGHACPPATLGCRCLLVTTGS